MFPVPAETRIHRAAVWLSRKDRLHSDRLAGNCTLFAGPDSYVGKKSEPALLAQKPDLQKRSLGLCIPDLTCKDLLHRLLKRHRKDVQKFVGVQLLLAEGETFCRVHVDCLVAVGAGGKEHPELDQLFCDRAGLLQKLARGAFLGFFDPCVELALPGSLHRTLPTG